MLRKIAVEIATATDQTATDYSASYKLTGKVVGIGYAFGDLANTIDFVITGETSGSPILTYANVPAANAFWHPRVLANKNTDGAAFTDAASEAPRVFAERIKIATLQGGVSKTGTLTFYIEDDTLID